MKDNKQIDTSRRELLKGLTTAAVAGTVVAGTSTVANANDIAKPTQEVTKTGYRETEHVREYYDTL